MIGLLSKIIFMTFVTIILNFDKIVSTLNSYYF